MTGLRDLDGYLARIGLRGRPDWKAVHRAHATSIPFENLDPASGAPVSLEPDHLEDKLVARRRGGYCFEHNLLLKAALESLGAGQITPMLARVRQGGGGPRPRSHLLLRVVADDGKAWHADVGFGGDTLLDPIPFGPGPSVEQSPSSISTSSTGTPRPIPAHTQVPGVRRTRPLWDEPVQTVRLGHLRRHPPSLRGTQSPPAGSVTAVSCDVAAPRDRRESESMPCVS